MICLFLGHKWESDGEYMHCKRCHKEQPEKRKMIIVGKRAHIDRGYKSFYGIIKSIDGVSCGGYWGTYEDVYGRKHLWDQTVDSITILPDTKL